MIRKFIVPGLMVCVFLAIPYQAGAQDKPTPKSELKKFQGVWQVEKAVYGTMDRRDAEKMTVTIDFQSGVWNFEYNRQNGSDEKVTFDPSKNPKAIDLLGRNGRRLGIYRSTDDGGLEVCLGQVNEPRPSAFTTAKGTDGRGSVYYLLKKKENK